MLYADKRALETNLKVNLLAIREKELNYYVRSRKILKLTPLDKIASARPYSAGSSRLLFSQSQNCLAIGTQAALLAGFAYSGLTQVAIPLDSEYVLKLLYLLVTTTAMCLELIAVMNTTLLSMMGPGLALRGPDGSMHPAVDGMIEEYQYAYLNFVLGLIAFHFSAALFGWLMFNCAPRTMQRSLTPSLATFPISRLLSDPCPSSHTSPFARVFASGVVSTFVSGCVLGSLYLLVRYASRVYTRFRLPSTDVVTGKFTGEETRSWAAMTGGEQRETRDMSQVISREQVQLAQASQDD